jgi:hypothetical protein
MSMLCITAAALSLALPVQNFTLAWTHSIEQIRWEEDYRITGAALELREARVRGSGAGMEVPQGAILRNGVWHYQPALRKVTRLSLARSAFAGDYELCWDGACRPMDGIIGSVLQAPDVALFACKQP